MLKRQGGAMARGQQGVSLLEVLIAVTLLSGAILAMLALHANALMYGRMSHYRGVATHLAIDVSDRMRANRIAGLLGAYAFSPEYDADAEALEVPGCALIDVCTANEIAAIDLAEMHNTVRGTLPGGALMIEIDPVETDVMDIWIIWLDPEIQGQDSTVLPCPFEATPQPQCLPMRMSL